MTEEKQGAEFHISVGRYLADSPVAPVRAEVGDDGVLRFWFADGSRVGYPTVAQPPKFDLVPGLYRKRDSETL